MVSQALERPRLPAERVFFLSMIAAIGAAVLVGFSRSVFLRPLFPGAHAPPEPYFYVHGVVFFAWVALLATQAGLIATNNTATHRRLGVAGFVMVPLMTVIAGFGALLAARRPGGFIDIAAPPLEFLAIPYANLLVFALMAGLALARRRDPQTHKRLMLIGMIALTEAAVARWPIAAIAASPAVGFWTTCAFLIPLAGWDFATRKALHPATLFGGMAMIAQGPVRDLVAKADAWLAFAKWATGLLG
jgi:hypothetical protein